MKQSTPISGAMRFAQLLLLLGMLCGLIATQPMFQARETEAKHHRSPTATVNSTALPLTMNYPAINSQFGVQADGAVTDTAISRTSELGAGWLRLGSIRWRELQPQEGGAIQWNSETDDLFRKLAKTSIKAEVIVYDYPAWATTKKQNCSPIKPDKYQAFASFMTQVINRYKTAEFNVHNWELGNEVDIDPRFFQESDISALGCWGDISDTEFYGGRTYGNMLKTVVPTLRAADSAVTIWHGGLLLDRPNTTDATKGKPERFLNGVLEAGGGDFFDVLPLHAYTYYGNGRQDYDADPNNAWTSLGSGSTVVGKIKYVKNILQAYNVPVASKKIFLNEVALLCLEGNQPTCRTTFDRVDDQFYAMQSVFIVRSYTRSLAAGAAGLTWFCITGYWRHSFLIDGAGPTPTYTAYQQFISQMRYATYKGQPDYGSNVQAWSFSKKDGTETHVIWANADTQETISVPQATFVSAVTMNGIEVTKTSVNGTYQMTATLEPIYVTLRSS